MKMLFSVFFVLIHLSCTTVERKGTVIKVIDGDTFDVLAGKEQIRVRLFGIDSPERGQAFNKKAKEYTATLVAGKNITLVIRDTDRYGRSVADAYLSDHRHVNAEIVKAGYAWHFKQFSNSEELARLEQQARNNKWGLWQDSDPVAPWQFRRDGRKKSKQL